MDAVKAEKLLFAVRVGIMNVRIYPPGSQILQHSVKTLQTALDAQFEETPEIMVSTINGNSALNGMEVQGVVDISLALREHDVQSLVISRGIDEKELTLLCTILGRKKGHLDDAASLSEWLRQNDLLHVRVDEVQYMAVQKGQMVVQHIQNLIAHPNQDGDDALKQSLQEAAQAMVEMPDQSSRDQFRKQIAHQLSGLPPDQLRNLLCGELPKEMEEAGLKRDVVSDVTREKLEETMEEISLWYRRLEQDNTSEQETLQKVTELKSFLKALIESPAHKAVPLALYESLMKQGLLNDIPEDVSKEQMGYLQAQVEYLMTLDASKFLERPVCDKWRPFLTSLCQMGMPADLQALTDKMLGNLQNPEATVRQTTVEMLRDFQSVYIACQQPILFRQIIKTLYEMAKCESSPEVYAELASSLGQAARQYLLHWNIPDTTALVSLLCRHQHEASPIGKKKKDVAAKSLKDFAAHVTEILCVDSVASDPNRQLGALQVLAAMGPYAVVPMMDLLKWSPDFRLREAVFNVLQQSSEDVQAALSDWLEPSAPADLIVRLLPLLRHCALDSFEKEAFKFLDHPDSSVRRQAVAVIAERKDAKMLPRLMQLLDDPLPEIRRDCVRILMEYRVTGAAQAIAQRLPDWEHVLQEEACTVLGHWPDRLIAPTLAQLVVGKRTMFGKAQQTSDAVRARAAWALGKLMPDPVALKTLKLVEKDSSSIVRRIAQQALRIQQPPLPKAA